MTFFYLDLRHVRILDTVSVFIFTYRRKRLVEQDEQKHFNPR